MEELNFVLDIGNSHIVAGVYHRNELQYSWRFDTNKTKTGDEYYRTLKSFALEHSLNFEKLSKIAFASVVPELTHVFMHLFKKYSKCPVINVNAYTDLGLSFPMKDPGFIGADLVVNAFSAKEKYKTNCIICDFGTATTIQLVSADGFFYGSIIAPGILTSAASLFKKASLLSEVELQQPKNLLGKNTRDSLLSGIIRGNTFMIDEFIRAIKKEYHDLKGIKTIATGGIAEMICKNSSEIEIIDKYLTIDGLNFICKRL